MTNIKLVAVLALPLLLLNTATQAQISGMDDLHNALKLRPEQEESWRTFQDASAVDRQEMARRRDAIQQLPNLTAPQRVDLSIDLMRQDLESLERRGAGLKEFYATLSPQQQAIFDHETIPRSQR